MITTAAMTSPIVGNLPVNLDKPVIPSAVAFASALLAVISPLMSPSTCNPNASATVTTTRVIPNGNKSPTSMLITSPLASIFVEHSWFLDCCLFVLVYIYLVLNIPFILLIEMFINNKDMTQK